MKNFEQKNLLNVGFGLFLKSYRSKEMEYTSEDIADRLDIGRSLYRMIEAGNTVYPSAKVFYLIDLFSYFFEEHNVEFERIAKYLIGCQYIDKKVHELGKKNIMFNFFEAAIDLKKFDACFDKLITKLSIILNSTNKYEHIKEEQIAQAVESFLTQLDYSQSSEKRVENNIIQDINNTYSLNVETARYVIDNLKVIQPSNLSTVASIWEKKNLNNFIYSFGFFSNKDWIINENNFYHFQYDYLFSTHFKQTDLIFLKDGSETNEQVKESFINMLNKVRKENRKKEIKADGEEWSKIRIIQVNTNKIKEQIELLLSIPKSDAAIQKNFNSFWGFTTLLETDIGFIGVSVKDKNSEFVYNLTFKDTKIRKEIFKKLWLNAQKKDTTLPR